MVRLFLNEKLNRLLILLKHKENLMEMGAVALSDPELKVEEYAMVPQTLPVPQKTPAKDTDEDEDELVERELQQFK